MPEGIDHATLFNSIYLEWEKAEKDIKAAETVCGEVVIPSIQELRYAGRRLAQALRVHSASPDSAEVAKLLQDACFNCHRARHDAIDASRAQIIKLLDIATDKLGYNVVLAFHPDLGTLISKLEQLGAKIAESRGNPDDRDLIYETIETSDFPELIEEYRKFRSCESRMKKMAQKQRLSVVVGWVVGIGGLVVATVTAVLSYLALQH